MIYDEKTYLADLRARLDDYRFTHSVNVAKTCRELAKMYGCDEEKAYFAGLLHDVFKNEPKEKMLAFFEQNGIVLSECERSAPKLWHAIGGSVYLQKTYGFDEEFIRAVRYHTTGRANMTLLEKIIYLADYIEPTRDFPDVDVLRKACYEDLDKGLLLGLEMSIEEMQRMGNPVHHATVEARDALKG